MSTWSLLVGDVRERLKALPDASVQCCITSPPYWGLRDYGTATWAGGEAGCDHLGKPMPTRAGFNERYFNRPSTVGNKQDELREPFKSTCGKCGARRIDNQIGLEATPDDYVSAMVEVFRDVRRVLRDDGTCWVNLGDSTRDKQLVGIPWRVAFALQADGWWLRQDIIWHKPNPMPESVTDRCTKAHEYVFLLTKSARYFYDAEAIKETGAVPAGTLGAKGSAERFAVDGVNARPPEYKTYDGTRNKRSVWTVTTQPYPDAHFATYPPALIKPMVLAGTKPGDVVLDPFTGSGTTGEVALNLGRSFIGIELSEDYAKLARKRIGSASPLFAEEAVAL